MKKTLLIKIVILDAVVMFWGVSTVHLYAAVFGRGPLMPWIVINLLAAVYMSLVAWATDSNGKEKDIRRWRLIRDDQNWKER